MIFHALIQEERRHYLGVWAHYVISRFQIFASLFFLLKNWKHGLNIFLYLSKFFRSSGSLKILACISDKLFLTAKTTLINLTQWTILFELFQWESFYCGQQLGETEQGIPCCREIFSLMGWINILSVKIGTRVREMFRGEVTTKKT